MSNQRAVAVSLKLVILALALGCGGGGGDSPTAPSVVRVFNLHLRSPAAAAFTARFTVDGVARGGTLTSAPGGEGTIVNASLEATDLARGGHVVRATIESLDPAAATEFRLTGSISENNVTVVPDVPDQIQTLAAGGSIAVTLTF